MKKYLKKKKILLIIFMTIFSLTFCCVEKVSASEEYTLNPCKYTEEYINWSKMSNEEKSKTQMPPICDYDATETNRLQTNVRESFNIFNKVKLPTSYDIRGTSKEVSIKDQKHTGQCWAFSTTSALEIFTKVSLGLDFVYSPRHIEYATSRYFLNGAENEWGFNREVGTGGHVIFSSAYLTSQVGPVLESDMPFEDNEDLINISKIQTPEVQLDVNNIALGGLNSYGPCTSSVITKMKEQIYKSGSVVSSLYFNSSSTYYNSSTSALYYSGSEYANHAVLIVGWDDNYSKSNFSSSNRPSSNGAWIVQNSYGTSFGDNGYNYVSYEDERICTLYMGIEDVDTELEENAYIYDKLGHNVAIGYQQNSTGLKSGHGLAVYQKSSNLEALKEVTIGSIGAGSYKIYFYEGDAKNTKVSSMKLVGSGTTDYNGYVTHKFTEPINISASATKFSIAVYWELTNNYAPIPLCRTTDNDYLKLTAKSGQTYISYDGSSWEDAASGGYIVSIKAFTDTIDYELSSTLKTVSKATNDAITVDMTLSTKNISKSNLKVRVFNSSNKEISGFTTSYGVDSSSNPTSAKLVFSSGLDNGTYTVKFYYNNTLADTITFTVSYGIISSKYTVSSTKKMIYVTQPTQVTTFLSYLSGYSGSITKSGSAISSGYIGTGMTLDGYTIILKGDVTGDGQIKVNDVMKISRYTVEGAGLSESYYKAAADVTGDNLVKVNDVMKISKYTVEGGSL